MYYTEDNYLQLSGIQHFSFCQRQWALIHIEQQWSDNLPTIEGELMHKRAHDSTIREVRGDVVIERGVSVFSPTLGVTGQCDVLEYHRDEEGISLAKMEGLWRLCPIEYKRGKSKETDADRLQLCCQAMCLEEMLCCDIPEGFLFYGETKRRESILFSDTLRNEVRENLEQMHRLMDRGYTPKVKAGQKCTNCSLMELCLPNLIKTPLISDYYDFAMKE